MSSKETAEGQDSGRQSVGDYFLQSLFIAERRAIRKGNKYSVFGEVAKGEYRNRREGTFQRSSDACLFPSPSLHTFSSFPRIA